MKDLTNKEFIIKYADKINGLVSHFDEIAKVIDFDHYHYVCNDKVNDIFCLRDNDETYFSSRSHTCHASFKNFDSNYSFKFDVSAKLKHKTEVVTPSRVKLEFDNIQDPIFTSILDKMDLSFVSENAIHLKEFILKNSSIIETVFPVISFNIDGTVDDISLTFKYKKLRSFDFNNKVELNNKMELTHYYTNNLTIYNKWLSTEYLNDQHEGWKEFSEVIFFSILHENLLEFFSCETWGDLLRVYMNNKQPFISLIDMHNYT